MLRIVRQTFAVLITAVFLTAAHPAAAADSYEVDKSHSEATFRVRHLVSKVSGRFNDFGGTIEIEADTPASSSVAFEIQTGSIDTAHADRDKHLRSPDFFDVEKFPKITFVSSKVVPKSENQFDVVGTLTLHGVSKEVTLPVSFGGFATDPWGNERAGFEVEFTLDRKDYGIVWNQALDAGGFILGDEVAIRIAIEATKKKAE